MRYGDMITTIPIGVMFMIEIGLATWTDTLASISDGADRFERWQPHGMYSYCMIDWHLQVERREQGDAGMHSKWHRISDEIDTTLSFSLHSFHPTKLSLSRVHVRIEIISHLFVRYPGCLVNLRYQMALARLASFLAFRSLHFLLSPSSTFGREAYSAMVVSP